MKLISWNVNGLRACLGKGFSEIFASFDADFVCLQETKLQEGILDLRFDGYRSFWNYADKKGYSGTAIYCREEPLSVLYGIGVDEHDHEGRTVTIELPEFYLVCVYVPNSQDGLRRLGYRMEWDDAFRNFLTSLRDGRDGHAAKPVAVCGDFNVAHQEIDLKNPAANRRNAGFSDEERMKFTELLNAGFTDTFRLLHPDLVKYSWWSYRSNARASDTGWRIDYFLTSEGLKDKIAGAEILGDILGSDHCPVELSLSF